MGWVQVGGDEIAVGDELMHVCVEWVYNGPFTVTTVTPTQVALRSKDGEQLLLDREVIVSAMQR